ncbi:division/cell wall cluster transcriptional repressor MraZ [Limosilactobacillus ingluviei]|uniref:division/cell wall cluster transcriptional repressor MraZ n=1 Tax=Limosilactobacillus ingluviei TaxID=148604 RepID=UPI0024B8A51F|nr:division/cell wall cluster transcriptional repressor MraZ [Limosilactobacillus ingluviei]
MFMGEFNHTIDPKGRLIIPAKFRQQLGERFVITRGLDQCLAGWPLSEWKKLQAKLRALPMTKKNVRQFVRFLYAAAVECEFDKQGRVNLSATLLDYAQLKQACVVVGVATHFEIWDTATWQTINQQAAADFAAVAEELDFDF